jgi:flagellar basal-body rod modification protein FlgD
MTTGTTGVSASSNTSATQNTINTSLAQIASNSQTFLTLLTTQLKNQDPLSPMDTNQFTQQLTQMSGVEQQLLGNQLLQTLVTEQGLDQGANLIGKTVTAPGAASGDPAVSGVVTGVQQVNGTTELTVGSSQIPLSSVISVSNGTTASSTSGQGS